MRKLMLVVSLVVLSACRQAPSDEPATGAAPAATSTPAEPKPAGAPVPTRTAKPAFADKVWRVQSSAAGEPGSTYAFLGDGTLVIDSPHGTPLYGQWSYDGGKLVMIEDGLAYPTDILLLDAGTLQLRSHNPGGSVDLTLVPAPDAPLPAAPPK